MAITKGKARPEGLREKTIPLFTRCLGFCFTGACKRACAIGFCMFEENPFGIHPSFVGVIPEGGACIDTKTQPCHPAGLWVFALQVPASELAHL